MPVAGPWLEGAGASPLRIGLAVKEFVAELNFRGAVENPVKGIYVPLENNPVTALIMD